MLIQKLPHGAIRTIRQHEHGLLSGRFAHHWCGAGQRPSMRCVLAVAMHDLCWESVDCPKGKDTHPFEQDLPCDFLTMPTAIKAGIYAQGIAQMEHVDPWAGLLLNLHFTAFLPPGKHAVVDALIASSRRDRTRLLETFGLESEEDATLQEDFSRLKFFDLLSLYVCMTFGDLSHTALPPWMLPPFDLLGVPHHLHWVEAGVLGMDPWGFDTPSLALDVRSRVLDVSSCSDARSFTRAWRAAAVTTDSVVCVPWRREEG